MNTDYTTEYNGATVRHTTEYSGIYENKKNGKNHGPVLSSDLENFKDTCSF